MRVLGGGWSEKHLSSSTPITDPSPLTAPPTPHLLRRLQTHQTKKSERKHYKKKKNNPMWPTKNRRSPAAAFTAARTGRANDGSEMLNLPAPVT